MKASGSPCQLHKISVIPFKRCFYLRSYLTELFRAIWQSGDTPLEWKRACTILIHKKGDTSDPANFRSITLENVALKISTSCLRDTMYAFLQDNGFIEHRIQRAFFLNYPELWNTLLKLANVISQARIKQRSYVISLLDLKNAFGEVHHTLIPEILKYHHTPDHI